MDRMKTLLVLFTVMEAAYAARFATPVVLNPTMSSFSSATKGGHIQANVETELFAVYGQEAGFITEQWFTGELALSQDTRIRIYIDNETAPSLDFNLFMAHGVGCPIGDDDPDLPWQTRRIAREAHGSVYNTYRIPFGHSVKVTATIPQAGAFWYIVRGLTNVPLTVGGFQLPEGTRLKLYKVENALLQPLDFVTAAQTSGSTAGWLYQVTLHANSTDFTYLEACFRADIDGKPTQFLSSGTEDFFLSAYYFNKGLFHGDHSGLTCKANPGQMSAYKFFEDDPVLFSKSLKLTWRCGESSQGENGCPNVFHPPSSNDRYSQAHNTQTASGATSTHMKKSGQVGAHPTTASLYSWVYEYPQ
ncbi:uncharacterized protein LOC135809705 [Sycon ciliatum]|uniref:uncharacterized protein LOC135809705 n=1 Tax=Sycon ciliatum TaxID=27933 RepID=UPI0031F61AC6